MLKKGKLKASVRADLKTIETFAAEFKKRGKKDAIPQSEVKNIKSATKRIMGEAFGEVTKNGYPTKRGLDREVVKAIARNGDKLRKAIRKNLRDGKISPMDYYQLVYSVLSESDIMSAALIKPELAEKYAGMMDLVKSGSCPVCDGCLACTACGACAACGACVLSVVIGAGVAIGTAGTGVTAGVIGNWL